MAEEGALGRLGFLREAEGGQRELLGLEGELAELLERPFQEHSHPYHCLQVQAAAGEEEDHHPYHRSLAAAEEEAALLHPHPRSVLEEVLEEALEEVLEEHQQAGLGGP